MLNRAVQPHRRHGFILITVLLLIVMLSSVLLAYNYQTRLEVRDVGDHLAGRQARHAATAGLDIAIAVLQNHSEVRTKPRLHGLLSGVESVTVGQGAVRVTVREENGKINVNTLKDNEGRVNRGRVDQLLRLIDLLNQQGGQSQRIDYGIVPAIMDWTDEDDQVTCLDFVTTDNRGAESSYYASLPVAYHCANRPFGATAEILRVKGMTDEMFSGGLDGIVASENGSGQMAQYLTVYGDGQIDINSAPPLVLRSLSKHITPTLAKLIIKQRTTKPFEHIADFYELIGITPSAPGQMKNLITISPSERFYRVTAKGTARKVQVDIDTIVRRNQASKRMEVLWYEETPPMNNQIGSE